MVALFQAGLTSHAPLSCLHSCRLDRVSLPLQDVKLLREENGQWQEDYEWLQGEHEQLQAAYDSMDHHGSRLAAQAFAMERDHHRLLNAFNQVKAELAQVSWAREEMRKEAVQRLGAADAQTEKLSEELRTQVELFSLPLPSDPNSVLAQIISPPLCQNVPADDVLWLNEALFLIQSM